MREIKFRVRNGAMVLGWEILSNGRWYMSKNNKTGRGAYLDGVFNGIAAERDQYTGLKDIHGVEIYEGDIVDFWSRRDYDTEAPFYINRRKRRVVQWISNSYKNTINIRTPKDENLAYHEVIGNIYENPELLEEL